MNESQKASEVTDDLVALRLALIDLQSAVDCAFAALVVVTRALVYNMLEEEQTDE